MPPRSSRKGRWHACWAAAVLTLSLTSCAFSRPDPQSIPLIQADTSTVTTPGGARHQLVAVPPGPFTMGITADITQLPWHLTGDSGIYDIAYLVNRGETPEHVVCLSGYWLDRDEVTNAQYLAFLNDRSGHTDADGHTLIHLAGDRCLIQQRDHGYAYRMDRGAETPQLPVVHVSWYGAQAYCAWAGMRLPTEAEWEKALRGGRGPAELPGGNISQQHGDVWPVGHRSHSASPYGARGMVGNVWEWVADRFSPTYYADSPQHDPQGPEEGAHRIARGGAYYSSSWLRRASMKRSAAPDTTHRSLGFRCARDGPDLAGVADHPVMRAAARKRAWVEAIRKMVREDCHLTTALRLKEPYPDRQLRLVLSFDNSSMQAYWSPEVAVQYIFSAALQPILKGVTSLPLYDDVVAFRFSVELPPIAAPEVMLFTLYRSQWRKYVADTEDPLGARARLFDAMGISTSAGSFRLDPVEAAGIE
jgi:formylglycine-generating enzyme